MFVTQMRRVLEEQGTRINAWRETDGTESCAWSAGEAPSARAAVDAAVPLSGRSDYPHGQPVVIVLGECADYRQVRSSPRKHDPQPMGDSFGR